MNIQSTLGLSLQIKNDNAVDFAGNLLARALIDQVSSKEFASTDSFDPHSPLRRLWALTDLSSQEFANEVAAFFGLRKLTLPELAELSSMADRFAPRFLREACLFPFKTDRGTFALAA